jgi:hypothetical protein
MAGWDPVETTGLPDDIDFTIVKAEFGYDAQYLSGEQILLIITASQTNEEGEPYRNFYSLGRAGAWESLDHGRSVVSQSDPTAEGFNKQSSYWKFIEAALGTTAASVIQGRGTPDNASIWEGLTFHMNRIEVDRPGLGEGKQTMLLPTSFVGEAGKVEASAPTGNGQPGAASSTNILELKIKQLAKTAATHDSFIEAVMEKHPEAANDEDLFSRVLDENGIYAEAH